MKNGKQKRILMGFFLLCLSGGVIMLIIMQMNWARQATAASRSELKRNLEHTVAAAIDNTLDESLVMLSLLTVEAEDFTNRSWELFGENIRFLEVNTPLFDFMDTIYLLPLTSGITPQVYDTAKDTFVPVSQPLPLPLQGYDGTTHMIQWWNFIRDLLPMGYYVRPVFRQKPFSGNHQQEDAVKPLAFLAANIDVNLLFSALLQKQLTKSLQEYPFMIRSKQKVYATSPSAELPRGRQADFIIPLEYPLTQWQVIAFPAFEEKNPEAPVPQRYYRFADFRFLLQQPKYRSEVKYPLPDRQEKLHLEIYYPKGPLEKVLATQTMVGQTASIGIIGVLIASLLLLYRLYTRMHAMREKEQEFVATISHELRTPLAVIGSASDNLSEGIISDNPKIIKYGKVIKGQAKRLSLMIENILYYAGLESRQTEYRSQSGPLELSAFITNLIATLEEIAAARNARLIFRKEDFRGKVDTDPLALGLILGNLLSNAIQHSTPASGEKTIIKLRAKKKVPRGLEIIIEDNGPGIPLKEQKKVFTAFFRGEISIRQQIPGSGLGLHLVKRVAGILDGCVDLESPYHSVDGQQQHGCRFSLHFPWEVQHD